MHLVIDKWSEQRTTSLNKETEDEHFMSQTTREENVEGFVQDFGEGIVCFIKTENWGEKITMNNDETLLISKTIGVY